MPSGLQLKYLGTTDLRDVPPRYLLRVNPRKIAFYGVSFGGYLAPRAAAFEARLAACIAAFHEAA